VGQRQAIAASSGKRLIVLSKPSVKALFEQAEQRVLED